MKYLAVLCLLACCACGVTYWGTADGSAFNQMKFTRDLGYCHEYASQRFPPCYDGSTYCNMRAFHIQDAFENCMMANGWREVSR